MAHIMSDVVKSVQAPAVTVVFVRLPIAHYILARSTSHSRRLLNMLAVKLVSNQAKMGSTVS